MKRIIVSALLMASIGSLSAQSSNHIHMQKHHHGDVPVGVMGGHTHDVGGVMLSYRYMSMHMDGNRDGTRRVSDSEVLTDYMVTPTSMDMDMHMFGAMVGVNDKLTVMAMLPYVSKSMRHLTRMGGKFTTKSDGIGDIKISGLYKIVEGSGYKLHLNLGVSLPTGSIDKRGDTPVANNVKLPYPMQLGSGTYDFMPGITYQGQAGDYSWGSQAIATIRTGENDNDYTLGNKLELSAWLQRQWSHSFSTSVRLNLQSWSDIDGADPDLNPNMIATADSELRAGKRADLLLGVTYQGRHGALKGNRFSLEVGKPVYQKLNGPQLETDLVFTAGWQYSF